MSVSALVENKKLDADFLQSIYDNDNEHASIVFEQFLSSYTGQIKEMEEAFKAGDINLFRQKIHKIKPTFSFVGLTQLTKQAAAIESKCIEISNIQNLNKLFTDFIINLNEHIPLVKTEYKKLSAS